MPGSESTGWGNQQHVDVMRDLQHQLVSVLGDEIDEDEDAEYDFSICQADEDNMSSDYASIDTIAETYKYVLDNDDAVQHHRVAFYRTCLPKYRSMQEGMHLINNAK